MTAGPTPSSSASQPGYEQARAELEDVVRRLEAGGVPLEESLALWERGEHLARQCQAWLDGARQRMQAVRDGEGGSGTAEGGSGTAEGGSGTGEGGSPADSAG